MEENVGREFAKEIGAIFRYTSAKQSSGIDDLFKAIGTKVIDPNFEEGGKVEVDIEHEKVRSQTIKISDGGKKDKGKDCSC